MMSYHRRLSAPSPALCSSTPHQLRRAASDQARNVYWLPLSIDYWTIRAAAFDLKSARRVDITPAMPCVRHGGSSEEPHDKIRRWLWYRGG